MSVKDQDNNPLEKNGIINKPIDLNDVDEKSISKNSPGPAAPANLKTPKNEKVTKAAKIILALGEENAAEVLRHMDERSVEAIAVEIAKINTLPANQRKEILEEFQHQIKEVQTTHGGLYSASQFLAKVYDPETARARLEQMRENLFDGNFKDFEKYSPERVSRVLSAELPRTTALVLTQFNAPFSARVLAKFENKYKVEVARQIAKASEITPALLKTLYKSLKKNLESVREEDTEAQGGEDKLAEILRHMDRSSERSLIHVIDKEDPQMAGRLKAQLTMFEDLLQLNQKEIRKVFENVPDKNTWAAALSGSGAELLNHVLGSVSVNRSSDITEQMQYAQDLPIREISKARREIVIAMEKCEEDGDIVVRKDREKLVE